MFDYGKYRKKNIERVTKIIERSKSGASLNKKGVAMFVAEGEKDKKENIVKFCSFLYISCLERPLTPWRDCLEKGILCIASYSPSHFLPFWYFIFCSKTCLELL